MSSPELPAPEMPEREFQSTRHMHLNRWLLVVVVGVVVVALVLGVLVRVGVIFTNGSSRAVVPAGWQTFHDPLKLYTLGYPPEWATNGGITPGNTTLNTSTGSEKVTAEQFTFYNLSGGQGSEGVVIMANGLKEAALNQRILCPQLKPRYNSTFHGLPAYHLEGSTLPPQYREAWAFVTRDAFFSVLVAYQRVASGLPAPTATPLPAAQLAVNQADVNGILASFQPTDPQPLACS